MRRANIVRVDGFDELYDRDIEIVIGGGTPSSTDLIPLRVFVAELRSLAATPVSPELIDFHAAESAASAAERHSRIIAEQRNGQRRASATTIRRRAATTVVGLTVFLGATGMAWAADGAVPGDWNYGLDRALESIGIGAGGPAERRAEQQTLHVEPPVESADGMGDSASGPGPGSPEGQTGLERAPAVVTQHTDVSVTPRRAPSPAPELLLYLNTTDRVDGAIVSAIAKGLSTETLDSKGRTVDRGPAEPPGQTKTEPPGQTKTDPPGLAKTGPPELEKKDSATPMDPSGSRGKGAPEAPDTSSR